MNYLTIEDIHRQLRIEPEFTEDDVLLESIGDGAEDFLQDFLDTPLDDICAQNGGQLPKSLHCALLLFVDWCYDNSGGGENREIPEAFFLLSRLYKKYSVA